MTKAKKGGVGINLVLYSTCEQHMRPKLPNGNVLIHWWFRKSQRHVWLMS